MADLNRKILAVGAVMALCLTAFIGISMASDDSDAAVSYTDRGYMARKGTSVSIYGPTEYGSTYGTPVVTGLPSGWTATVVSGSEVKIAVPSNAVNGAYQLAVSNTVNGQQYTRSAFVVVNDSHTGGVDKFRAVDIGESVSYTIGNSDTYVTSASRIQNVSGISHSLNSSGYLTVSGTPTVAGAYLVEYTYETSFTDFEITDWVMIGVRSPTYTHTVSYSANGGTGNMANTVLSDTVNGSSAVTLVANGFSKSGYSFAGWKVGNTIYQPGQTVSVGANTTVNAVAQWTPIPVTITSSGDGADIIVGDSFSRSITTDPSGATVTFSGPSWLTLSGSTLVGTPTTAGDYSVTVDATNGVSSNSQSFTIHVVNRLAFESIPTGGILATPVI